MNVDFVFESVFKNSFEGLMLLNDEGEIITTNSISASLLGYTTSELKGKTIEAFLPYTIAQISAIALEQDKEPDYRHKLLQAQRKNYTVFLLNIKVSLVDWELQRYYIIHIENLTLFELSGIKQSVHSSIVNNSNDAIISKNLEGKVISWNPRATKILGYTHDEMMGESISKIIPDYLLTEESEIIGRIKEGEVIEQYETERLRKDGSLIRVTVTIAPIVDADNKIIGASKILRDITEIRNSEKRQKTLENYYSSTLKQSSDLVFITDASDKPRFLDMNDKGCEILGYSKEEILQLNTYDIVFIEDFEHNPSQLRSLHLYHHVRNERRLKKKDGSAIDAELSIVKLVDGNFMTHARDITQKKKTEAALIGSEKRFRALVENNHDIISLVGKDFLNVIYRSPSSIKIMGFTAEEQDNLIQIQNLHPNDRAYFLEQVQKATDNPGLPIMAQFRRQHKSGHYVWLEGAITNLLHDDHIKAYVLNLRDVSERVKAEENLRDLNKNLEKKVLERTVELEDSLKDLKESEEKFLKVFHTSAAAIALTRASDLSFTDVNETFEKMVGFSKAEILGRNSIDLNLVIEIDKREQILEELKTKGSSGNYEMTFRTKSGKVINGLINIDTVYFKGEAHFLNIIYDITALKTTELKLVEINKELESFAYSVSHDLRAPLRAVSGYAEILHAEYASKLDSEADRLIQTIIKNASRMGVLIDDLLAFSRLGRKEMLRVQIDSNRLLTEVMQDIEKSLSHKALIKIDELPIIMADYGLLKQVFINLISNAIKYSARKAKPEIQIRAEESAQETHFLIQDNGAGFDMRYADKLFGVFSRLHSQEEFEGTGVGLAIVQRIVTRHGGRVWAEGKVNHGATLHFTIPKH